MRRERPLYVTYETKEEELTEKLEELNKKYLLLYSDFENFRKRTSKEKIELIQNAAENTIKDLLPVVDDYERALVNFEKFEDEKFLKAKEGIELIYNKLMQRVGVVMATPVAEGVSAILAFSMFIPMIKELLKQQESID